MGAIFSKPSVPQESEESKKARQRAEERAAAAEQREMKAIQAKTRVRRTGGFRLLMSPARQGQQPGTDKLGG